MTLACQNCLAQIPAWRVLREPENNRRSGYCAECAYLTVEYDFSRLRLVGASEAAHVSSPRSSGVNWRGDREPVVAPLSG